ncbi:MAG: hypothetical protein IIA73_06015 [Proteobacteria bacterium]|nr:hypothetical protein [Pseudomonadota bacterium]
MAAKGMGCCSLSRSEDPLGVQKSQEQSMWRLFIVAVALASGYEAVMRWLESVSYTGKRD